jgi:hypothetical protein
MTGLTVPGQALDGHLDTRTSVVGSTYTVTVGKHGSPGRPLKRHGSDAIGLVLASAAANRPESISGMPLEQVVGMKKNILLTLALMPALIVGAAHAAPVVPAEGGSDALVGGSSEPASQTGSTLPATTSATATRTSRAVEMLIDMQGKSAGLDFSAGTRALDKSSQADSPSRKSQESSLAPMPEPARASQSGLFGSGATPVPATRPGADPGSAWRPATSTAGASDLTENGSVPRATGAGTEWDQRLNLPRTVVAWVRDHRSVVVVLAIGLLALMWGGSIAMGQRRR